MTGDTGLGRGHAAALAVGFVACCAAAGAAAQQPPTTAPAAGQPGWSFNLAPYLWLPQINTKLDYQLSPALGGRLPTSTSTGPGDFLPNLKFATMLAADARYGPVSALTDLLYVNVGAGTTNIRSLDFFELPSRPIDRSLETGTSSTVKATIWTLAGTYTVLQGGWGNLDVLAGFRMADIEARTNFDLALTVTGPRGNGAMFGGAGGISGHTGLWDGIAGLRGSLNLGTAGFFVPYYFDIGAGGSVLTWQVASGIGYRTGRFSFSAQYRYLAFEQGKEAIVRRLSLGGPMVALTVSF